MKGESADSPRTSAGISKSLLTPCRRLGLTRRRVANSSSLSPLSSPASSSATPATDTPAGNTSKIAYESGRQCADSSTPSRRLPLPRRNKSKKLLNDLVTFESSNEGNIKSEDVVESEKIRKDNSPFRCVSEKEITQVIDADDIKKVISIQSTETEAPQVTSAVKKKVESKVVLLTRKNSKQKSPKRLYKQKSTDLNLKRKCMVILDSHILKSKHDKNRPNDQNGTANIVGDICKTVKTTKLKISNAEDIIFSEVDDIPLSKISTKCHDDIPKIKFEKIPHTLVHDDENTDNNVNSKNKHLEKMRNTQPQKKFKVAELVSSKKPSFSSNSELKKNTEEFANNKNQENLMGSDSEDDDFHTRKTILIRKSYPKVSLYKAKSTGSITQNDIDNIKARIRMKQNALLAKSGGHNIVELTELIKKWRKGCQEALLELLEIMKQKVPDKQNMNTAELLKMLNIPPVLVDYNMEDDCFVSQE